MKKINYFLPVFILLFANNFIFSQSFVYVSPKDNSILVSLSTNIILKSSEIIDPSSLSANEFSIVGTLSGEHTGTVKLSDDNKTVLFFPATPFSANEDVTVNVNQGIKTADGAVFPQVTIHFKTTPLALSLHIDASILLDNESINNSFTANQNYKSIAKTSQTDTLPSNFPAIKVDTSNNPADGKIFLSNISQSSNIGDYLMILNNDGSVLKYKKVNDLFGLGFTVLPNGELSYADVTLAQAGWLAAGRFIVMDTSLAPVDTFQCGNGYIYTFPAEFRLLPNGHVLLYALDPEPVDMSQYGGSPNATVAGAVIQELDASKNVVFQWRTWDYLPITDSYIPLNTNIVDLIHANALDDDANGNILFSMRYLSSIIKIDRQTGNIDWILGGKQNQFAFINEHSFNAPNYFSYQHDIRVLPNGDITFLDNGNQHTPQYSRGVEYAIDDQSMTATLVWEYRHTPDFFAVANGSVQKLANGNTIIGWGQASVTGTAMFTEVHSDNSTALEFSLPPEQYSFRALKFPWASGTPAAAVTQQILATNTYAFNNNNDTTGVSITFSSLNSSLEYVFATVTSYDYSPVNPTFNGTAPIIVSNYFNIQSSSINSYTGLVNVNLKYFPAVVNLGESIVYARSGSDGNFIPLPTSYNSTNNEITFTTSTLGDFAFGIPQTINSAYAPVPISPADSEIVLEAAPVKLVWGTRGIVQTYHLQVSTNPSFSNLVVDNSSLTPTSFTLSSVNNNSTYYWRVNNTNAAGTSAWSNTEVFSTAPAFIKMLSPNGGEKYYLDSTYIIRWQSNLNDTVNIKLMEGNNIVLVIGDTIVGGTNAYQWQVPSNLKQDSSYKIMVSGISNAGLYGLSNSSFTITSFVTGVTILNNTIKSYQLSQNYPNPFNPSTVINYSIPQESHVRIDVFNIIGQRVTTLVNTTQKSGNYEITWNASDLASGVYFYSIRASDNSGKNFFAVKKMMLLK